MSLFRRFRLAAVMLAAYAVATLPSNAQTVTASLTADDVYAVYSGLPVQLAFHGSDANVANAENYSFSAAVGSFVYVAAWDLGGSQAFQGVVTGPGGTFRSNLDDWVFTVIPASRLRPVGAPGGWDSRFTAPPPIAALQTALSSATWSPVLASRAHAAAPWGGVVSDPATLWIWSDSVDGGTTDGSLVVFRTATPVVSAIPEPSSALMMLVGIGMAGFLYRRRMQPLGNA